MDDKTKARERLDKLVAVADDALAAASEVLPTLQEAAKAVADIAEEIVNRTAGSKGWLDELTNQECVGDYVKFMDTCFALHEICSELERLGRGQFEPPEEWTVDGLVQ